MHRFDEITKNLESEFKKINEAITKKEKDLEAEITRLRAELYTEKKKNEEIVRDRKRLLDKNEDLYEENDELLDKVSSLKKENKELGDEMARLKNGKSSQGVLPETQRVVFLDNSGPPIDKELTAPRAKHDDHRSDSSPTLFRKKRSKKKHKSAHQNNQQQVVFRRS